MSRYLCFERGRGRGRKASASGAQVRTFGTEHRARRTEPPPPPFSPEPTAPRHRTRAASNKTCAPRRRGLLRRTLGAFYRGGPNHKEALSRPKAQLCLASLSQRGLLPARRAKSNSLDEERVGGGASEPADLVQAAYATQRLRRTPHTHEQCRRDCDAEALRLRAGSLGIPLRTPVQPAARRSVSYRRIL